MVSLFQRHCSDETLICHLDGELPFYSRAPVGRHLKQCWRCRLRLSEIESQVLVAMRALENDAFPGPERIAAARCKFLADAGRIAAEVSQAREQRSWLPRAQTLAWASAALIMLCGLAVWRLAPGPAGTAAAAAALERVAAVEADAARLPAHQKFRVVEKQLRPVATTRENLLEVWSEPARGRFATSFRDTRGVVRHAIWQPAPERQYVLRPSQSSRIVKMSRQQAQENFDLSRDGITLDALEGELLNWLERRSWSPVSISKAMASLASADGAELTMHEIAPDGHPLVRLTARKTTGAVNVEFVLDLDKTTSRPRLQSIRYESPSRSLALELYSEDAPPAILASFEPPQPPATAPESESAPPSESIHLPSPVAPPAPNHTLLEAEVHRALHEVRACLGETIEVETGPDGRVAIRGAVAGPERRDQLLAALAPLADPRLTVDIKSAAEILREIPATEVARGDPPATAPSRPGHAPSPLAPYFGGSESEAQAFAERVLSSGEAFMRDAQALRQLSQRFGGRSEFESAPLRPIVLAMEHDHLAALQTGIEYTRRLMAPILPDSAAPAAASRSDLNREEELRRIFQLAAGLNERLRRLLVPGTSTRPPELLIREIGEAFRPLQSAVTSAMGQPSR